MCCCTPTCANATTTGQPGNDVHVENHSDGSITVHVGEAVQIQPNDRDGVTVSYGTDKVQVFPTHDGGLVDAINSSDWAEKGQRGPVGYLVLFNETTLYGNLRHADVVELATIALGTQSEPDGRAAVRGELATGTVI